MATATGRTRQALWCNRKAARKSLRVTDVDAIGIGFRHDLAGRSRRSVSRGGGARCGGCAPPSAFRGSFVKPS
jgi:hypothetical protein